MDARSIAVFRVLLAGTAFYDMAIKLPYAGAFFSDAGILPRPLLRELVLNDHNIFLSLNMLSGAVWFQQALLVAGCVLAVMLALGVWPRAANLLLWAVVLSYQARNPVLVERNDVYLRELLFFANFIPLAGPARGQAAAYGGLAMVVQIACAYLFTGLHKARAPEWFPLGLGVERSLQLIWYAKPLADMALAFPVALRLLTYLTVAAELLLPVLLFVPLKGGLNRLPFIVAFAGFHLGVGLTLDVGLFTPASFAALALLLPARVWDRLGARWKVFRERQAAGHAPAPSAWALPAVAVACMACVLYFNVADVFFRRALIARPPLPLRPAYVLGLNQAWLQFVDLGRPDLSVTWIVASGRLPDGTQIDLLDGSRLDDSRGPGGYAARFPSYDWRTVFHRFTTDRYRAVAARLVRYLCATRTSVLPLERVELSKRVLERASGGMTQTVLYAEDCPRRELTGVR